MKNSTNEKDTILEIFIANLIHNRSTFDELFRLSRFGYLTIDITTQFSITHKDYSRYRKQ